LAHFDLWPLHAEPGQVEITDVSFMDEESDAKAPRLDLKFTNLGSSPAFIQRVRIKVKEVWKFHDLPVTVGTLVPPEFNYIVKLKPEDAPYALLLDVSHGIQPGAFSRFTVQLEQEGIYSCNTAYLVDVEIVMNRKNELLEAKDIMILI